MLLLCEAHLHLAPLFKPKNILDIGTGTGIWAIQMAEQYPESTIWGTDLSPIQPSWLVHDFSFPRVWGRIAITDGPGSLITYDSKSTTSRLLNGVGRITILTTYTRGLC